MPALPITFQWPLALWALLLVPVAAAAYAGSRARRRAAVARFANPRLLPNLVPVTPGWRRHVPVACYLLALAGLLAGLARPQAVVAVPRQQATVVMVMDTSSSMVATDVAPNRLAAANAAAKRFVRSLPPELRLSIVSFSANAQLVTPPTTDRDAARLALDSLRAGGGTAMGDALELARGVVQSVLDASGGAATATPPLSPAPGTAPPAAILLLSDGAQTAGQAQPLDAAARLARLGVPVYTIALGTAAGVIDSPDNPGQPMAVPPDEAILRQIAQATGGEFFPASSAADLGVVYENIGSRVGYTHEPREITSAFAAAGAALLAAGGALGLLWFNRVL